MAEFILQTTLAASPAACHVVSGGRSRLFSGDRQRRFIAAARWMRTVHVGRKKI
jgi:hypothetical protein